MKRISFLFALLFAFQTHAAFTMNARRYLSPRDLFNVMAQKFPILGERAKLNNRPLEVGCYAIVPSNENVIGVTNPAIGTPAVELPPPGFVRWLGSCGHKIVSLQIADMFKQAKNEKLWTRYWPADLLAKYRDAGNLSAPYHALGEVKWSELDPALKSSLLSFTVREMIGPESVIRDLGYAKSLEEVKADLAKTVSDDLLLKDALHNILLGTILREEFLTY